MASGKQKRKLTKKPRKPGAHHPDGDRRRRGGMTADQGTADKRARQAFFGVPEETPDRASGTV
ncbi:MAG TPA: hypothetical protein VM597_01540 [Gemmataceae bacterium]|nr:hypothetical protein [Gemmataceae bacterium]